MINFRNPKYVERYEDVYFELDSPLVTNPANNAHQVRNNNRIFADNTGESTPFDWYHARFNVNFKLQKLADGAAVGDVIADTVGMVNSSFSLIKKLSVKMFGVQLYECDEANQAMNIKNLLEYSRGYSESQGTNEFFYLDTEILNM